MPENTDRQRLLVVGLDGLDPVIAQQLIDEGALPRLAALQSASARCGLDAGVEKYTGLAWDHFSTGVGPSETGRWSACELDVRRYEIDKPDTRLPPFTEKLDARTVVFDAPYFDVSSCRRAEGAVCWGAHDPGIEESSRPETITAEILERFGPYPAKEFIYGHVWPDAAASERMGRLLTEATELRTDVTRWVLRERLPDWDLAVTVIAEYHSATEGLWHGWDQEHPLHRLDSAKPARDGFLGVYHAADKLLGALIDEFPDARILAFTPHGMGPNFADVPAMILLPELLYRHETGERILEADPAWTPTGETLAPEDPPTDWAGTVTRRMHFPAWWAKELEHRRRQNRLRGHKLLGAFLPRPLPYMDWLPAVLYRPMWPRMKAFAFPSFYDGQVRINLEGREAKGIVKLAEYGAVLDEIGEVIRACTDPSTGRPLAVELERRSGDPLSFNATEADLNVRFEGKPFAFEHPTLGMIGPAPCRRPGGHTGGHGLCLYDDRSGRSEDLGLFKTLEMSSAVAALMGGPADADLARALLARA